MDAIYQRAFLVISADRCLNPDMGLLGDRYDPSQVLEVASITPGEHFTQVVVCPSGGDARDPHDAFHTYVVSGHLAYEARKDNPLLNRAWCFQEKMLATRIIHFALSEIVWECAQGAFASAMASMKTTERAVRTDATVIKPKCCIERQRGRNVG